MNEYNLYSDLVRVISAEGKTVGVELINRRIIHPEVKVIGNVAPKVGEDGFIVYVGRFKQPYFIPFSFNYGSGGFVQTNESNDATGVAIPQIDRSLWVNKLDFIDFSKLKYVTSSNNTKDINWCTPQFAEIFKNIVNDWEAYCTEGRNKEKNNKNVIKLYPILQLGYMGRNDAKLTPDGYMLGTPSKGTGHTTGRACDVTFENDLCNRKYTDDYLIIAIKKYFDICKKNGITGIGYNVADRYIGQLNSIYHLLSSGHDNHFHTSSSWTGTKNDL